MRHITHFFLLIRFRSKFVIQSVSLTAQAQALVVAGKPDRALLTLKLRRFREDAVDKVDAQLFALEELVELPRIIQRRQSYTSCLTQWHSLCSVTM